MMHHHNAHMGYYDPLQEQQQPPPFRTPFPQPQPQPQRANVPYTNMPLHQQQQQQNYDYGYDQQQPQQQSNNNAETLYKTEMCRKWTTTGTCRYGGKCQFAHGEAELRTLLRHPLYKTTMCKSFQATGSCRYGTRCRFIHNESHYELAAVPRMPDAHQGAHHMAPGVIPEPLVQEEMLGSRFDARHMAPGVIPESMAREEMLGVRFEDAAKHPTRARGGDYMRRVPSAPANLTDLAMLGEDGEPGEEGYIGPSSYATLHKQKLSQQHHHHHHQEQSLRRNMTHSNFPISDSSGSNNVGGGGGFKLNPQYGSLSSSMSELFPRNGNYGLFAPQVDAKDLPIASSGNSVSAKLPAGDARQPQLLSGAMMMKSHSLPTMNQDELLLEQEAQFERDRANGRAMFRMSMSSASPEEVPLEPPGMVSRYRGSTSKLATLNESMASMTLQQQQQPTQRVSGNDARLDFFKSISDPDLMNLNEMVGQQQQQQRK